MPVDRQLRVPVGIGGLNLRESPAELGSGELVDSLNWRIDQAGALVKRLGMKEWSQDTGHAILEVMILEISGGETQILAHCDDGHIYKTIDGTVWSDEDSGLSTTGRVVWVQYLDTLYYCDGTNDWRSYDGSSATTESDIPAAHYAAIWRNRLWVAEDRDVSWSKAGDPTDFTTYSLNTVSFPDGSAITGLAAAPNISSGVDGADGVLVFTRDQIHRIYDDTDNVSGTIIGGANVLIDTAIGCQCHRSIASLAGRTYFLGQNGVYSTDGHSQARVESAKISTLFTTMAWGQSQDFGAIAWEDRRYLLTYAPSGSALNSRVLELALDLPAEQGQHPWMAHDMTIGGFVHADTATGELLYGSDSSAGDEGYVRQLFTGGYDIDGLDQQTDIRAICRTGAQLFGTQQVKRMRRIELLGRGQVTVAVSSDLSPSAGEARSFDMVGEPGPEWGTMTWGSFTWGSTNSALEDTQYFSQRGRYLTLEFTESGQGVVNKPRSLGYAGGQDGGAAVYSAILKIIPLDQD